MTNGRCRLHGGKSLAGVASPTFVTGRYSKHLPARLADQYLASRNDPELLALRDEVAIVDSRLNDLLGRVDTGESGALWKQARKLLSDYRTTGEESHLYALGLTINEALDDYAAWQEIQLLLEQRRKLVETERKRLVDMQQMITAERAMLLIAAISDTIRRHVSDRNVLAAINADLGALINRPAP